MRRQRAVRKVSIFCLSFSHQRSNRERSSSSWHSQQGLQTLNPIGRENRQGWPSSARHQLASREASPPRIPCSSFLNLKQHPRLNPQIPVSGISQNTNVLTIYIYLSSLNFLTVDYHFFSFSLFLFLLSGFVFSLTSGLAFILSMKF